MFLTIEDAAKELLEALQLIKGTPMKYDSLHIMEKALDKFAKQEMCRLIENISHSPIRCYSVKERGKEKIFYLGKGYVDSLINSIKK